VPDEVLLQCFDMVGYSVTETYVSPFPKISLPRTNGGRKLTQVHLEKKTVK